MRQEEKEGRIELAEGLSKGRSQMCDYSLHSIKSRPAKIGDRLTVPKTVVEFEARRRAAYAG